MNEQLQSKLKRVLNSFPFYFGTSHKRHSKPTTVMLFRLQQQVNQGIWSHMKFWDPEAELIKDESTGSALKCFSHHMNSAVALVNSSAFK